MRKIHLSIAAAAAAGLLSVAAVHAQGGPADPAKVSGGTYTSDPNHTQVLFTYTHFGLTHNMGLASGAKGTLTIDPTDPNGAKLSIDVPISSIHTTIAPLDQEFQGPMFFDAAKFPNAHFESTKVTASGTSAKIEGNLTIHGVTKPAEIDATLISVGSNPMSKKETIAFSGKATINRADFGVGAFVPMVSAEVELNITAAFEK
jgi:polyisoprenoid-binding protein YceI